MSSRPLRAGFAAALAGLALSGCGKADDPPAPAVRLSVDAPADLSSQHEESVEVHGVVSPATATVRVEGEEVDARSGRFSANVDLQPGTNLIDVQAGAPGGARPAIVAVRVTREVKVAVPDLAGFTPSDAEDALASVGLEADVHEVGGLFELLLPEDARVCETDPQTGSEVDPGTTVDVLIAKRC